MLVKLRNYALAAIVIGACIMGLMGPLLYPEYLVQPLVTGYYIPMV